MADKLLNYFTGICVGYLSCLIFNEASFIYFPIFMILALIVYIVINKKRKVT